MMAKSRKKKYPTVKTKKQKVSEPVPDGFIFKDPITVSSPTKKVQIENQEPFKLVDESSSSQASSLKIRFISSSLSFFYFLVEHLGEVSLKILPSIFTALGIASELQVTKGNLKELYRTYWQRMDSILSGESQKAKHWGITFFSLLIDETDFGKTEKNNLPFFTYLEETTFQLKQVKNGERSVNVVINFILNSKEIEFFPELKELLESLTIDHFLNLNQIYDKILNKLDSAVIKEDRIRYWRQIIKAFCYVLNYSTKMPESFIKEIKKDNSLIKNELSGILMAYFICKLYYDKPYEKAIPTIFLNMKVMRTIAPLCESLINYQILIKSANTSKLNLKEYFWAYVWGKPYSMFENPTRKEVKRLQKKLIEVEEEVIVEEKNFGDFIKVYTEPKPTGIIRFPPR